MNSKLPQTPQASNIAEEAIKALSLLDPEDQKMVLDYITTLIDSQDEQGDN